MNQEEIWDIKIETVNRIERIIIAQKNSARNWRKNNFKYIHRISSD